jgi:hypothetical protein
MAIGRVVTIVTAIAGILLLLFYCCYTLLQVNIHIIHCYNKENMAMGRVVTTVMAIAGILLPLFYCRYFTVVILLSLFYCRYNLLQINIYIIYYFT